MIKLFTIVLSNQCNLSCKYCYVNQHQVTFPKERLLDLVDFIDSLEKDPKFSIWIFGGEPLTNKEILRDFIKIINNKYHIQIVTNGTLLDKDFLDFCIKYNVNFNISLDGCEECHNLNRIYKNGKGSFDNVYNGIKLLQQYYDCSKKKFIGTAVITKNNYTYLINNLSFLKENNFSINFSFDRFCDWSKIDLEEYKKVIFNAADYYIENIENLPYVNLFYTFYLSFLNTNSNKNFCDSGSNMITIDPNLNLYPCPSFIGTEYSIGNLNEGIDYKKLQQFYLKKQQVESQCSNCKYFSFKNCYGKCLAASIFNKTFSDNLCKIFFINLQMNLYVKDKLNNNKRYLHFLLKNGGKI